MYSGKKRGIIFIYRTNMEELMKTQCDNIQIEYFAAANTSDGFFSLFDKVFSPEKFEKIYILKGGPGCGKSTLLKRVAQKAKKLGYSSEIYYCSQSPTSLDGVVIPELSVAILDGTSPHTRDPIYPAVCENIVNLGQAWDIEKAGAINEKVRQLTKNKKSCFGKAYAYLSSVAGANSVIDGCVSKYLLESKLERNVERICSKLKIKTGDGEKHELFTDCNSAAGNIHLFTFENLAQNRYFIKDFAGIARYYFDFLRYELERRKIDFTTALDTLEPCFASGIYIEGIKTSFTLYDDDYARTLDRQQIDYKIINCARFCHTDNYHKQKVFLKYAEKSKKVLLDGAMRELALAGKLHDDIEKLYYEITDYSVVEKIGDELLISIFGE